MEEQTKILKAIETGGTVNTTRLNEGLNKVIEIFDSWEPIVEGYAGFPVERDTLQKKKAQFKDDRNIGRVVQAGGSSYVVTGRKSDGRYIVIGKGGEKTAKDPADMGLQVKEHIDIEDLHQAMLEKKMDGVDDNGFTSCWKGYKKRGTKMKGGKEVNDCVKEATAMAKRGYDEAPIRSKIAKSTGGGKAADRASDLESRSTYGDANKAKQRQNYARKQRGDFRSTTSSSPGLHGYGHKSDDPKVKEKQAARGAQRGALTPNEKKNLNREEFEIWVDSLVEEGYDLSDFTWDEMYDIYEGEGSYGKTPNARQAMGKLAIARREKPASEYSQKGEKTKKVKAIEKHTQRIDNGPNVGNRGKRSTPPRWSGGRGKMDQDSRDYSRADSAEYGSGTHGRGTVTKNPKKLRKQKAMGEEFTREQIEFLDRLSESGLFTEAEIEKIMEGME